MKKILITGASGFFGRSVIDALKKCDDDFACWCLYHKNPLQFYDTRFHGVKCDLLDEIQVKNTINHLQPTHIIHLAWYVVPQKFWSARENIDWLYASINLFQVFCDHGGHTFVGSGTLAEYNWENGILDEINTPLEPNTLYGQSKKSLHEMLVSIRNTYYSSVKIIWPRIGYFFGENESQEKLISKLIYNIKNRLNINLVSAEFKRPYAHIKYFGDIMVSLLMDTSRDDLTLNMSSSVGYMLREIVAFIEKVLGQCGVNIKYDAYIVTPTNLVVNTRGLNMMGLAISDTFFDDLKQVVLS